MTHLIYTPLGPNGTVKLSKLPTVSSFHARFTNRLNKAIASRSSKSAQEQSPKQQPRSPTKVKKTEPHTPSCRSPGTRKATALSALEKLILPANTVRQSRAASAEIGQAQSLQPTLNAPCHSRDETAARPTRHAIARRSFGLISLFDGLSTPARTLIDKHNLTPKALLLAENLPTVRALVCEQYDIPDDPSKFHICKHGIPVRYLGDVWIIFDKQAEALLQFLALLQPHDRIMLVTSSPCQDLTVAGTSGGRLGFTGKQSSAFHAVHLLTMTATGRSSATPRWHLSIFCCDWGLNCSCN